LFNPTPFVVEWNWDKGVDIVIEPDGFYDLVDVAMLNDFHDGQPGAEAIKERMGQYGIFIRDPSRSFDAQALEAITAKLRADRDLYNTGVTNLRSKMAGANMSDPEVFNEHLTLNGYASLKSRIDALETRAKIYKKALESGDKHVEEQYDPKRTLLFHSPPKVFESELQMSIYLSEHPDEAVKHKEFMTAMEESDGAGS
jgi:hypothetical protein